MDALSVTPPCAGHEGIHTARPGHSDNHYGPAAVARLVWLASTGHNNLKDISWNSNALPSSAWAASVQPS